MSPEKPAEHPVPRGRAAHWTVQLALDLTLIIAFAMLGRTSHEHGLDAGGVLMTAAPFAAACLLSWAAVRGWRAPRAVWPTGVVLWLGTAAGGLAIRALFGGGVDPAFQLVAGLVLGAFLLIPRVVINLVRRSRTPTKPGAKPRAKPTDHRNQGANT